MTTLDSILKSKDIALPTKVPLVKAMVIPVVIYGCEIWTKKKSESQRIDAFELLCWRRLLWVPWTARRSNQSILKAINPEYWLEGLMLKLKLQYFGHLMGRADSLGKNPDAGKDWRHEGKGKTEDKNEGWHHQCDQHEFKYAPVVGNGQGGLTYCSHVVQRSWTGLSHWSKLNWTEPCSNQAANTLLSFLYKILSLYSVQFSPVTQSGLTLWHPMNRTMPGLPVHHQLPELTQTHVHWVGDVIQPSHSLPSPSLPALNLSHHQGLFKWVWVHIR